MSDALGELRSVRTDEPLADDAVLAARRAVASLERWMTFVDRLVECGVFIRPVPLPMPSDASVAVPWLLATERGWQLAADPLPFDRPPTVAEVELLAAWLATADLSHIGPDDLAWLTRRLGEVAADAALTRAFDRHFDGWDVVVGALARRRVDALAHVHLGIADRPAAAGADATLAALAAVWARANPGFAPDVGRMQPYAAATFVRHLPLDARARAALAGDLLVRWHRGEPSPGAWWDKGAGGPNTADLLFEWLLDDADACAAFVAAHATDLPVLLYGAADASLLHRVVVTGTDPSVVSIADGGDAVLAILRGIRRGEHLGVSPAADGFDPDWTVLLGDLVAPWLLQFSPLADAWPASVVERRDLLAMVLDDERALARLATAQRAAVEGLAANVAAGGGAASATDIAAVMGLVGELIAREQVADEEARAGMWNLCWQLLAVPTMAISGPAKPLTKQALAATRRWSEQHGWLGAPDPALVARHEGYAQAWLATVGGATMVAVGVERLIARGDLPATTPPPPRPDPTDPAPQLAYEQAYRRWRRVAFAGRDDALAVEIDGWKGYFLSTAEAGRATTTLP